MRTYKIFILRRAQKEMEKIPRRDQLRIREAIRSLELDPFQGKQLRAEYEGKWAVRVWPYRIMYIIEKNIVTVTVFRIAHRKDVYR